MLASLIAGSAALLPIVLGADGTTSTIDLSSVDFTPMVSMINSAVPTVLTAIVPIVGTRKVISFIIGAIKGA